MAAETAGPRGAPAGRAGAGTRAGGTGRTACVVAAVCGLLLAGCGASGGVGTPAEGLGAPAAPRDAAPSASATPAPPSRPPRPTAVRAADLRGLWGAGEDDGAQIVYEFDGDGTYTRISLLRQKRDGGTFRFQDVVEGTYRVEDGSLTLRPTAGTQTVDDPSSDGPVSTRTEDLDREVHSVDLLEGGTVLVLTPRDGAPLTLGRQGS